MAGLFGGPLGAAASAASAMSGGFLPCGRPRAGREEGNCQHAHSPVSWPAPEAEEDRVTVSKRILLGMLTPPPTPCWSR
ncbi:hypothetical protein [Teichococcus aestuarii]|uniref:hypothetical protein n=1 Tax=Teichococcus aestuarii TaxID=568898 RepID=UPI00361376F1